MIARGFRPVVWVFMIGAAVLVCYMLNLRVAAERAELAKLDRRIVATQQSIRALQTEVGTRSRIPQLEEWNEDVLALSAPVTGQYLQSHVSLASFDTRQPQLSEQAEVRLASAETGETPAEADRPTAAATPAPQRAIAAPPAARPEIRRVSLAVSDDTPILPRRETAERPRRDMPAVIRTAARDERRPAAREERARPAPRDERRAAPVRTAARDERGRPAPTRTASRDERRPTPVRTGARDERRPAPARATTRAAAATAPVRTAARMLANERAAREPRKDSRPERRRAARD